MFNSFRVHTQRYIFNPLCLSVYLFGSHNLLCWIVVVFCNIVSSHHTNDFCIAASERLHAITGFDCYSEKQFSWHCIFVVTRPDNNGKINKETTWFAYLCCAEALNYKKSVTVWKLCKRSFKWDLAGYSSSICLEMAQKWIKTLPYSDLWFNWIKKVLKRSSLLWQALTLKRFELQIWDWS